MAVSPRYIWPGGPTEISRWTWEIFGTANGFGSDSESDGLSNGLDYALCLNPMLYDSGSATTAVANGIRFCYRPLANDLRYLVQQSTNLTQWSTVYACDTSTGIVTETGVTGTEDAATGLITSRLRAMPRASFGE